MWKGSRMLLLGITSKRRQILVNHIEERGGQVYSPAPKVAPLFAAAAKRKRDELPSDLTHIICDERYDHAHASKILADAGVDALPEKVKVVKAAWVSECVLKKSEVPVEPYIIMETAQLNQEGAAAQQAEGPADKAAGGGGGGADGASKKVAVAGQWSIVGKPASVHAFKSKGSLESERVAAFDLDSTLVTTKSGKGFPSSPSDWKWWSPQVPGKLRELHSQGYKVVIVSNQNGVEKGKVKAEDMRARVAQVIDALGLPIDAYCAAGDDIYRKPRIGIWQLIAEEHAVDASKSFFVGDAAGRPKLGDRRKDFSASDVMFAVNAGIGFQTPEEFFLGSTQSFHSGSELMKKYQAGPLDDYVDRQAAPQPVEPPTQQEAVLLVGPAGVGKSTYCKARLPHHVWVNQDTLKRRDKCQEVARAALREGKSVVIDATNRQRSLRKEWVSVLREAMGGRGRVRFVAFYLPRAVALHLNTFRGINPLSADPRKLPDPSILGMFNDLEPIDADEGHDELVEVRRITPAPFQSQDEERLFFMHLRG